MRRPIACANWKMAMTIAESLAFVRDLEKAAGPLLDHADVVLFPPFTSLWAVSQARRDRRIAVGGQNIAPTDDPARTGEISAALLADAGCEWVMLGHWEVRRNLGDDEEILQRKVGLALQAGLRPMLLVGEGRDHDGPPQLALHRQLERILDSRRAEEIARMTFVYEPEGSIGVAAPATPEHVASGCAFIRTWLRGRWGDQVADSVRIIYGGSVSPEHASALLSVPDVDGLGATRRGRSVSSFLQIVQLLVSARHG